MTEPRVLTLQEIIDRWAEIRPLLESIRSPKRYWAPSAGEAFQRFHAGHWNLWVLGDPIEAICAVGVAKENDESLSLRLELVAGHADWFARLEPIAAYGRSRGCVRVTMPRARRGWLRRWRGVFKCNAVFLEAPL